MTDEHGVRTLLIDRPEKRNAITAAMYTALAEGLRAAREDDAVAVVVITGQGATFTAGNDLRDFLGAPPDGEDAPVFRFIHALVEFDKPLVAAVRGAAVGLGTTMLLHCDLVYAGPSARFHLPFVDLGLVPEAGSSLLLPRLAGHRRAAQILMLGEPFDAETAVDLGLVNAVVPEDDVLAHAQAKAAVLAGKPRAALRQTKRLMRGDSAQVMDAMRREASSFVAALRSPEAAAAFRKFLAR
jgi:enoyl-CoA hydratase/carnithine racemase